MKKLVLLAAVFALAAGCKKKKPEEGPMPTGSGQGMGSGGAMGSAMGSAGAGSAATMGMGSGSGEATKPMTGEQIAARFSECWDWFSNAKWDQFKTCYAPDIQYEMPGGPVPPVSGTDAVLGFTKGFKDAFPDLKGDNVLVLVNGHSLVGVTWVHGTMTGAFKTPMGEMPATKNKIGMLSSQWIDFNDKGEATHEWEFVDMATMMGQMKPDPKMPVRPVMDKAPMDKPVVVVAKDDDKEKANLEVVKKGADAWSAHKAKDFGDLLADDVVWSEQDMPKDFDKKTALANFQAIWKGFSDIKVTTDKQWAAGDYVTFVGALDGTNDGDVAFMKIKKTGKKVHVPFLFVAKVDGGKIKNAWIFEQQMAMASQLGMMPPAGEASKKEEPKKEEPKKEAPKKEAPKK